MAGHSSNLLMMHWNESSSFSIEDGVCTMCAPRDQRKSRDSHSKQITATTAQIDFATFNTAVRECIDLFSLCRGFGELYPGFHRDAGPRIRNVLVQIARDKADARPAKLCGRQGWAGIGQRRAEFELAVPKVSAFVWEMTIDCKVYPISLFD